MQPGSMMIALSLALFIAVYALGVGAAWRRAGIGRGITWREVSSFVVAAGLLAITLSSPVDRLADDLFAAHMAQHVLLAVVVPPLLVCGAPVTAAMWALPVRARRRVNRALPYHALRALTHPVIATVAHFLAIWMWHARSLYQLALRSESAHALEHVSFAGTGALLWWTIVHPRTERRTGYAVGLGMLFITAMHTGVLGALITLSRRVWYPAQTVGAASWGMTALEDQELAGLIIWVAGGLIYVAAMSILFVKWLQPRRPARLVAAASIIAAAGCTHVDATVVPGGNIARGKQAVRALGCGACHTIDGLSGAHGEVGPPLTGVARRSIIAGQVANTPENLMRWLENPQAIEPNTAMPNLGITPQSARDIAAYLYTLR